MSKIFISQFNPFVSSTELLVSKKKSSRDPALDITPSARNPPRVRADAGVSVRQQIAWAKAFRRLIDKSGSSNIGKKFRKEKSMKSASADSSTDDDSTFDYRTIKPPAVFVDGYNLIFYKNSLKWGDRNPSDLASERDSLVSDLCVLRGVTGWEIEVIFDAYKAPYVSSMESRRSRSQNVDNVIVTFTTSSETADTHIEKRFSDLQKAGFTNLVTYLPAIPIVRAERERCC